MRNKEELKKAVKVLSEFVEEVPGGESYWIDDEGEIHNADMGYVCEFLSDLEEYLSGNWESRENKILKSFPSKYNLEILYENGDFSMFQCQGAPILQNKLFVEVNPYQTIKIPLKDISSAYMMDLETSCKVKII